MNNLNDYIITYPSLNKKICNDLIDVFERNTGLQDEVWTKNARPRFKQVNFTANLKHLRKSEQKLHDIVVQMMKVSVLHYSQDVYNALTPDYDLFPTSGDFAVEEFRIKKYEPNDKDEFAVHVDVHNHSSARRYLAMLWYLNDDYENGETEFPRIQKVIRPITGNVLMFPPLWMFPHSGKKPMNKPKYIMSSYLHYV